MEECRNNLELFLHEAFPQSTGLRPFGSAQHEAIGHIQHNAIHGGKTAIAFPRGFAKTAISVRAAMWATLFNHRRYVPVFCLNEPAAQNLVDMAKTELCENPILLKMFPGLVCFHALEGKAQRCKSQHIDGNLTHISWRADRVVYPTVRGVEFSGNVLQAKSKEAARGLVYTNASGDTLRPDFLILDDIQDDKDALSPTSVSKIVSQVKKGIMRGGGHSRTLSAVMNCTCIQPHDVAEAFLTDAGWHGIRYRMVETMPTNMHLWEGQYRELMLGYDRMAKDPTLRKAAEREAMRFYMANRAAMDEGALCTWEWAYAWADEDPTEVSAIQHAMNILLLEGKEVFMAECQNDPIRVTDGLQLKPEGVKAKAFDVQGVPQESTHLVIAIDVQQDCLPFAVAGFSDEYAGGIASFSVFPEQEPYFNAGSPGRTLREAQNNPSGTIESGIYYGLEQLVDSLMDYDWTREDGMVMRPELVLVDSAYKTETVELFARSYKKVRVLPTRGVAIGAKNTPIDEKKYEQKPGESRGNHWEVRKTSDGSGLKLVHDANFWKSFVWNRYATPIGAPASWRVMKLHPQRLQLLADQVTAEFPTRVEANGRTVDEWQVLPARRDNHGLDINVLLAIAANVVGCRLPNADLGSRGNELKRRTRVKFNEV